jgi:hypothetical protein
LRLDRPAGLALADFAAVGRGHADGGAIGPRHARRERRLISPRGLFAAFRDQLDLALVGRMHLELHFGVVERLELLVAGPHQDFRAGHRPSAR